MVFFENKNETTNQSRHTNHYNAMETDREWFQELEADGWSDWKHQLPDTTCWRWHVGSFFFSPDAMPWLSGSPFARRAVFTIVRHPEALVYQSEVLFLEPCGISRQWPVWRTSSTSNPVWRHEIIRRDSRPKNRMSRPVNRNRGALHSHAAKFRNSSNHSCDGNAQQHVLELMFVDHVIVSLCLWTTGGFASLHSVVK